MARSFDVVVLGTGVAGHRIAERCREAGREVAIVDPRPYGGTCALRGCDPKKVLVAVAEAADRHRRLAGKGMAGQVEIDWPALMAFKRTFVEGVPEEREAALAEKGIATLHGRARFAGPRTVDVGGAEIEAGHVAIATGARPADLPFPGAEHVITSEAFLELERLPERIAFVGGGFISFEFAHVAARAGARTWIVEAMPRVLSPFDPELVERLVERTRALGIDVRTQTEVRRVEPRGGAFAVGIGHGGREEELEVDLAVHGAGRVPDIDDLDLDAGGVRRTVEGVEVNGYLQSVSNPSVYAAGDAAAAGPPLTPVAAMHGRVVAENILDGNQTTVDHTGVAAVVFTIPPLASVGLGEKEAAERGLDVDVRAGDASDWANTRRAGGEVAGYKVLVERGGGRILGAHLLGPGADEVVNLFALAVRLGLTAGDLEDARLAYPTHGSDVGYMLQ